MRSLPFWVTSPQLYLSSVTIVGLTFATCEVCRSDLCRGQPDTFRQEKCRIVTVPHTGRVKPFHSPYKFENVPTSATRRTAPSSRNKVCRKSRGFRDITTKGKWARSTVTSVTRLKLDTVVR